MPHDPSTSKTIDRSDQTGFFLSEVRFEHLHDTLGIGEARPRLSWKIETLVPNWRQSAYEIELIGPDGETRATSGRIQSGESVLVPWPFPPLASRQQGGVRVRVWNAAGQVSGWSEVQPFEAGLLQLADWSARFITPAWDEDVTRPQPSPFFRREFDLRGEIAQARLFITSLGVFEAQINGAAVGDQVMPPGWSSYSHRLRYQTYDVTATLHAGRNCLGAIVADGWFRGRLGFGGGARNLYGDRLALIAQLEVTYQDGTSERIVTDSSWRAATGPILASDIYDGETYDARLEQPGWSRPGFNDAKWDRVWELSEDIERLVAPCGPPVRRIQEIHPVSITRAPSGKFLLDFGQNLVGRLRIRVQGPAGQAVTLRHAEVLQDGELCTRLLRTARCIDSYTLRGEGVETWEPRFTFHGFRYADIDGWPGELQPQDVTAVVCHSDIERTGWFECSDPLLNQLHENVTWSMRGNFLDLPTDCPQRDERLGWTGDIQVFSPTASFLYDVSGFLQSWLADLAAEQKETGTVAFVIPSPMKIWNQPAAAWGDAAVIVPWVLYQRYGDLGILERQFESMRGWVDLIAGIAGERYLWDQGLQFGDWLDPSAPPDKPSDAQTPSSIVATAYFAYSAELVGRSAGLLGRKEEEAHYLELARHVREAFNCEFVTGSGRILSDSATAYALALQFALLENDEQRHVAGERLAALVRGNRYHISTGFVGTPLICDALSASGQIDAAFRLLTQTECPSWLYPVTMGATTIWERWDSLLPDGSVNPGEMTSFNHYALGAVADWMHRTIAGLAPAAPGYRRLVIQPIIGGKITSARAKLATPYGLAECRWSIAGGQMDLTATIPPNTTASVYLPGKTDPLEVGAGTHRWQVPFEQPVPDRAPITMESTIDQLIDDPVAYARVMGVLAEYNHELTDRLQQQVDMTIRQAIALMPRAEELYTRLSEALSDQRS